MVGGGGARTFGVVGAHLSTLSDPATLSFPPSLFASRSLSLSLSSSPAFLSAPRPPRAWPATDLRARTREKTTQSKGGGSETDRLKERRDAEAVRARARVCEKGERGEERERAKAYSADTHAGTDERGVERSSRARSRARARAHTHSHPNFSRHSAQLCHPHVSCGLETPKFRANSTGRKPSLIKPVIS